MTARGSLQVRGLRAGTVEPFAAMLAEAGLADARPAIHLPPLAGRDSGPVALADALRAAVSTSGLAPRLAPKVSVVVDGPGGLHLDLLDADLRIFLDGESPDAVSSRCG